jgi:hypothetical protein
VKVDVVSTAPAATREAKTISAADGVRLNNLKLEREGKCTREMAVPSHHAVHAFVANVVYHEPIERPSEKLLAYGDINAPLVLKGGDEESVVYSYKDKLIFGFRGSATAKDFLDTDIKLLKKGLSKSERFETTFKFVEEHKTLGKKKDDPGEDSAEDREEIAVSYVGHSLGGALAVAVLIANGNSEHNAVIFNAGSSTTPVFPKPVPLIDQKRWDICSYTVDGDVVSSLGVGQYSGANNRYAGKDIVLPGDGKDEQAAHSMDNFIPVLV